MNLKVGDSVFVVTGLAHQYDGVVSKIGRKYFYVNTGRCRADWKFDIETMLESCNFRPAKFYLSRADYEQKENDRKERAACLNRLRDIFYHRIGRSEISTEKLKRICAILDE